MVRSSALSSVALLSFGLVRAQTYTVTETVDACPASYSNVPGTVTVQSSVTVIPTPLTDTNLNSGTPFIIQVAQYSAPGSVAARAAAQYSWLTANGSLTNVNSSATEYHINGGRLYTSNGLCVSANSSTAQTILAASPACGPFSGNFTFQNDVLNWTNSAFFDRAAQFFGQFNATSNTTQVMAMLNGLSSAKQLANRLVLYAKAAVASAPASPTASSTVSQSSSLSSYSQPSSSSSLVSTPNELCGGTSGYTCAGASFGTCCSSYGFCGSTADYCGTGCQDGFGACGAPVKSASASSAGAMSAPSMPVYSNTSRSVVHNPKSSGSTGIYSYAPSSSMSTRLGPGPVYADSSSMATSSSSTSSSSGLSAYTPHASSSTTTSSSSMAAYTAAGSSSSSASSTLDAYSSTSILSRASSTSTSSSMLGAYFPTVGSSSSSTSSSIASAYAVSSSSTSTFMSSSVSGAYASSPSSMPSSPSPVAYTSSTISSSSLTSGRSTTTSTTTSSTSSASSLAAYTPAASYVSTPAECPANNGSVVQDSNDVQWSLYCGSDSTGASSTTALASNSFNDCFLSCDTTTDCLAITYVGLPNGAGQGTCYLKPSFGTLVPAQGKNYVCAKRLT